MKVNTVEQFKIMEFLKENFELELFQLELLDRYSIKVSDSTSESMIFKYENGKVTWE